MRARAAAVLVALIVGAGEHATAAPPAPGPSATPGAGPSRPPAAPPAFTAIVLGAAGGLDESSLTSVLVARAGDGRFVALDAGTLFAGIARAASTGAFGGLPPLDPPAAPSPSGALPLPTGAPPPALSLEGEVLRRRVRAYLVSHPHLDHVAGLALAAPDDERKPIAGLAATLDALRAHLWNGTLWPNFTDEGPGAIGRYSLQRLPPGQAVPLAGTPFSVEAHPLAHAGQISTAFLLRAGGAALLSLGDTGPDEVERQGRLRELWTRVAPLVRSGELRAVLIECSYPDPRPDAQLFGHLTPRWLERELGVLAALVAPQDPAAALGGLTVVVTHVKPTLLAGPSSRSRILDQLAPLRAKLRRLIVPTSGERLEL